MSNPLASNRTSRSGCLTRAHQVWCALYRLSNERFQQSRSEFSVFPFQLIALIFGASFLRDSTAGMEPSSTCSITGRKKKSFLKVGAPPAF